MKIEERAEACARAIQSGDRYSVQTMSEYIRECLRAHEAELKAELKRETRNHPPLPPNFPLVRSELVTGIELWMSSEGVSAAYLSERIPLERKLVASFAAAVWHKLAADLSTSLPRPTYNHTREDSFNTPCPECQKLQMDRHEIAEFLSYSREWIAWGEKQP